VVGARGDGRMNCPYYLTEYGRYKHRFDYCQHPHVRPTGDKKAFCRYIMDLEKCPLLIVDSVESWLSELQKDKLETYPSRAIRRQLKEALNLTYYRYQLCDTSKKKEINDG